MHYSKAISNTLIKGIVIERNGVPPLQKKKHPGLSRVFLFIVPGRLKIKLSEAILKMAE
jgi:hypothetical protein